ncbi:hypothetical protein L1887_25160 [Cichorium endivia]|nr:hypothetical protein L1887_25160 [Cichorium endivia]
MPTLTTVVACPHFFSVEKVVKKWIPIIKEQWLTFVTNMEPHARKLSDNTVEFYHESKKNSQLHITNIKTILDPYIKEVKKFTKPYVNRLSKTLKAYVNKARSSVRKRQCRHPSSVQPCHVLRRHLSSLSSRRFFVPFFSQSPMVVFGFRHLHPFLCDTKWSKSYGLKFAKRYTPEPPSLHLFQLPLHLHQQNLF